MVALATSADVASTPAIGLLEGFHAAFIGAAVVAFTAAAIALVALRGSTAAKEVPVG
jgi:hypothetical protein